MDNSSGGIGLGSIVAAALSWMKWHSIGWGIVHAFCGWAYVVYYAIQYGIKF